MKIKDFDKAFGIFASIDEEKSKFVTRIENTVFDPITQNYEIENYEMLFKNVCYGIGVDSSELIYTDIFDALNIPNLKTLSKKDFIKTLRIIVATYENLSNDIKIQNFIDERVKEALEAGSAVIGVKWSDGVFYPSGENYLDKELIDTAFAMLDKYPNEKKDLKNALDNYNQKSLYGVVDNCYKALEGVARQLLKNKKTLDHNKEDLFKTLQFSKYWDKLFANYLSYAHEFHRHAGENRHSLKQPEVEGFLYLTCLIIRAILQTFESNNLHNLK